MSFPQAKLPISGATRISGGVVLPDELIEEVLSHLPVESLMQLRCVCKSWKTLISDPHFVNMHLQQSQRNRNLALILSEKFYYDRDASVVPFPVNTLLKNQSITIPRVPHYRLKYRRSFRVIGSYNGLLCLFDSYSTKCGLSRNACFRLWNPSTRRISKRVGNICNFRQCPYISKLRFAFGYDKSTDAYKVVAFSCKEVRIFSFRDNVWKNIQCFPLVPFYRTIYTLYKTQQVNEGVYLNGTINWLAIRNSKYMWWSNHDIADFNVEQCVIIALDLGLETYCQLRLPCGFVDGPPPPNLPTLAVLKHCLCFCHHIRETHFVIWMMMEFGVEESWTQFLKISYHDLQIGDLH